MKTADDWIKELGQDREGTPLGDLVTRTAAAAGKRIMLIEAYGEEHGLTKEETAHLHIAILSIDMGTGYEMLDKSFPGTFDKTGIGPLAKAVRDYEP